MLGTGISAPSTRAFPAITLHRSRCGCHAACSSHHARSAEDCLHSSQWCYAGALYRYPHQLPAMSLLQVVILRLPVILIQPLRAVLKCPVCTAGAYMPMQSPGSMSGNQGGVPFSPMAISSYPSLGSIPTRCVSKSSQYW